MGGISMGGMAEINEYINPHTRWGWIDYITKTYNNDFVFRKKISN